MIVEVMHFGITKYKRMETMTLSQVRDELESDDVMVLGIIDTSDISLDEFLDELKLEEESI